MILHKFNTILKRHAIIECLNLLFSSIKIQVFIHLWIIFGEVTISLYCTFWPCLKYFVLRIFTSNKFSQWILLPKHVRHHPFKIYDVSLIFCVFIGRTYKELLLPFPLLSRYHSYHLVKFQGFDCPIVALIENFFIHLYHAFFIWNKMYCRTISVDI
jgi:hypothetical protein